MSVRTEDVRPFTIDVPEEQLDDLRRRITATKWPDRETDPTQGVRLDTIQALADYWATGYDWRAFERRFAALPHFVTEIDGVDIHFIHVRSAHDDALPLIVTHGWPGSTIEQLKIIEPLTDPTAHGASASDAFHLVIPSLPGHGFSGKPTETGWDPIRIARAWVELMNRLGYTRFVAQGGDWGNAVTEQMALLTPPGLLGIHTNMPATVPPDVSKALATGGPPPAGLSADEKTAYDVLAHFFATGVGYANEMANRPQTLYGIADSPVGLAAWMLDHDVASYELIARAFAGNPGGLSRDDVLDNVTHYWLTNSGVSSARLYWESKLRLLRHQGRRDPGRRDRLPGRAVPGSAELGGAGVSQARPLQPGCRRRPLRGLGAAADLLGGGSGDVQVAAVTATAALPIEGRLPDLGGATAWLNTAPLTPAGLRGKVVAVQFCTFSCINWLRTVPYVRAWAEKYRDDGLVVLGVHSPEFPFEHDLEKIRSALEADGRRVPGRGGQRLLGLACLRQRVLARPLLRRRRGPDPASPLRRGGLRAVGAGHPAAARRVGTRRRRRRPGVGRAGRRLPRRRLGRGWGRRRPTSATPGPPASRHRVASYPTAARSTASRRGSRSTTGPSPATGRWGSRSPP